MSSTTKSLTSDKLGTMPIGKLILTMSGPAILSMLVQALYNIVDSVFIGMYDATNGVLALSYAMPMQLLINAFAIGLAVGTSSLISRLLGERKHDEASNAAQTGLFLALVTSAIFLAIGYFVSDAFIKAYTLNAASNLEDGANWDVVYQMGSQYLTICTCCSFGMMLETMFNRILQSTGNMIVPMICQIVGAVTNIILDPILISVAGMGAPGAAVATVIGQVVAMCIPIGVILKGKKLDVKIFFDKSFRLKKRTLVDIFKVGLPTIVMNSIGSIMYMVSNIVLNTFKDAVWAFGIYFKLQSFAFMPLFGLNQGCIPIFGYNYGANLKKRFKKTYKIALIIALCYMAFALILFHAMPDLLLKLFSPDTQNKIEVGKVALRICAVSFVPAAVSVITIAMFNAVGHGIKAMLISLVRQIALIIPVGILLSKFSPLGLNGYWTAFPIAEAVAVFIFLPLALATIKKIFAKKQLALDTQSSVLSFDETADVSSDDTIEIEQSQTDAPVDTAQIFDDIATSQELSDVASDNSNDEI